MLNTFKYLYFPQWSRIIETLNIYCMFLRNYTWYLISAASFSLPTSHQALLPELKHLH